MNDPIFSDTLVVVHVRPPSLLFVAVVVHVVHVHPVYSATT
jgi:hypothetical protein